MISKRGPLIAGIAAAVVALIAIFYLVLPKSHAISEAQKSLDDANAQYSTLQSQLAVLKADEAAAASAKKRIRKVAEQVPPTIDQQGLIVLLQNSADQSGVDLFSVTFGTPAYSEVGFATLSSNITVTGTYFALDEFLFELETFPRAAKVLSITLAPSASGTSATGEITMQLIVEFYTTDSSSGPGGEPGASDATTAPASGA
jgi:Tfp pilus assembly protein PilO